MAVQMLLYSHCKSSLLCGRPLKQGNPSPALVILGPALITLFRMCSLL